MTFFRDCLERYRRAKTIKLLCAADPQQLISYGEKLLLPAFRRAAKKVPAYKEILKEHRVDPRAVHDVTTFKKYIPVIDKNDTFSRFEIENLCVNGNLKAMKLAMSSSGFSGVFSFGINTKRNYRDTERSIDTALDYVFDISRKKTFLVNCVPMGVKITTSLKIAETSVRDDMALALIKKFSPKFDQTIIVSDPHFLKKLIEEGNEQKIDWKKLNISLVFGEDWFSESFRSYMAGLIGLDLEPHGHASPVEDKQGPFFIRPPGCPSGETVDDVPYRSLCSLRDKPIAQRAIRDCPFPPFPPHRSARPRRQSWRASTGAAREIPAKGLNKPQGRLIGATMGIAELDLNLFHESQYTILIRRKAQEDERLRKALFGENIKACPVLLHYYPHRIFLEALPENAAEKELVFSMLSPHMHIPLLRYNSRDRGDIIPYNRLRDILAGFGLNHLLPDLKLPLVWVAGRKERFMDMAGKRVYPEDIKQGLYEDFEAAALTTGYFKLNCEKKIIEVQLKKGVGLSEEIKSRFQRALLKYVDADTPVVLYAYRDFPYGMELNYEKKFCYI